MRISDWSSDVCSSDLAHKQTPILMLTARDALEQKLTGFESGADDYMTKPFALQELAARLEVLARRGQGQSGRASCRERVCQYVEISVVDGTLKKKKNTRDYEQL